MNFEAYPGEFADAQQQPLTQSEANAIRQTRHTQKALEVVSKLIGINLNEGNYQRYEGYAREMLRYTQDAEYIQAYNYLFRIRDRPTFRY